MMRQVEDLLRQGAEWRQGAFFRKNARFFRDQAEYLFVRGMIEYLWERPLERVAASLREGLEDAVTAFELGYVSHAWEIWNFFTYALAVRDDASALFLRTLPETLWRTNRIKPVPWLVMQVRAGFALAASDDADAEKHLGELREAVVPEKLPPELLEDLPLIKNDAALLGAVAAKNAPDLNDLLAQRMETRARAFANRNKTAPAALMDLNALGVCALGRRRGMAVGVKHVYLPLDLLDVPVQPPKG